MTNTLPSRDPDDCDWPWLPPSVDCAFNQPSPSGLTISYPPASSQWACFGYFRNTYAAELAVSGSFTPELFTAYDNDWAPAVGNLQLASLDQGPMAYDPLTQVVDKTCEGSAGADGSAPQTFQPESIDDPLSQVVPVETCRGGGFARADASGTRTFQPGSTSYADGFTSDDDGEYELDPSVSPGPLVAPSEDIRETDGFPPTPPVLPGSIPFPIAAEMMQSCTAKHVPEPLRAPSLFLDRLSKEEQLAHDLASPISVGPGQLPSNFPHPVNSSVPDRAGKKKSASRPTRPQKSKATLRLSDTSAKKPRADNLKVRIDPLLQQFRSELQVLLAAELVQAPAIGAAYKATRIVQADDPRCTNSENARAAHLRTYRGICRLTSPTDASIPPCGSSATNVTKHRETAHPVYEFDNLTGKPCWVYNVGIVRGKILHPSEKTLQTMSKDEAINIADEQRIELTGWTLEAVGI